MFQCSVSSSGQQLHAGVNVWSCVKSTWKLKAYMFVRQSLPGSIKHFFQWQRYAVCSSSCLCWFVALNLLLCFTCCSLSGMYAKHKASLQIRMWVLRSAGVPDGCTAKQVQHSQAFFARAGSTNPEQKWLSAVFVNSFCFRLCVHSHIKGHSVHHLTAIPHEMNRTRARPLQSRETGWWRVMKNIFRI